MDKKLHRFFRKAHRALTIPFAIFFLAKIYLNGTQFEGIAQKLTSTTMLFMIFSGLIMYYFVGNNSKSSKRESNVKMTPEFEKNN